MTLRWLAGLMLGFIVLAVPWWFGGTGPSRLVFGMPGWAVYSLAVTLVFAVVVAWVLATRWKLLERGEERWEDEDAG